MKASGFTRWRMTQEASAVLDYAPLAARACAPRAVTEHEGYTAAELFACRCFSVTRLDIRTRAALYALDMLRRMALGLDVPESIPFTPQTPNSDLDI